MKIAVPVYNNFDIALNCLERLIKFTPTHISIQVLDDASTEGDFAEYIRGKLANLPPNVSIFRRSANLGFIKNCNEFFDSSDCDVILVNSDVLVGHGWFESMTAPLASSTNVGTVTAITNEGGLAGLVHLRKDLGVHEVDLMIESKNFRLAKLNNQHYLIPVGVGHCMLVTRKCLNLVGNFDEIFSPGYCEEVDFSIKATIHGLEHHLARTFVFHAGGMSFGNNRQRLQLEHDQIIAKRYPNYFNVIRSIDGSDNNLLFLSNYLNANHNANRVLIDARLMLEKPTGTSRLIENIIKNLDYEKHDYSILVASHLKQKHKNTFGKHLKVYNSQEVKRMVNKLGKFDLIFVPNQVTSFDQLTLMEETAKRFCFLQLDFISFKNWTYFSSAEMYEQYKNVTRQAFSQASGIGYISNYIKNEAQMLIPDTRKRDTYIGVGVDHFEAIRRIDFSEKPKLIVMYGAAFSHKNRMYAIKLFIRLLQEDSTYCFMIIGPIPSEGTLIQEEEDLISQISQIIIRPWISDEELRDTVAKARLVIYPTATEGFGFVPFEAAHLGTPTLFNLNTSLKEVLAGVNLSLQYDLETDLKTLQQLLADETANYELLSFIRETSLNFTWKNALGRIENWITDLLDEVNNQSTIYHPNNFIQQKLDVIQRIGSNRLVITILPLYTKRRKFMKKLALNLFRHKYI